MKNKKITLATVLMLINCVIASAQFTNVKVKDIKEALYTPEYRGDESTRTPPVSEFA